MISTLDGAMKRLMHPALAVLGITFGVIALLYLKQVHGGIVKHSPPCAPITAPIVLLVFTFTASGAALGVVGLLAARRWLLWLPVALLAVLLNAAAFTTWGYWIGSKTLLPYHDWCTKLGMG
jgi:hypothetical protein